MTSREVDTESLALALDRLAHEVLNGGRPPQDAWEQLRQDLLVSERRY